MLYIELIWSLVLHPYDHQRADPDVLRQCTKTSLIINLKLKITDLVFSKGVGGGGWEHCSTNMGGMGGRVVRAAGLSPLWPGFDPWIGLGDMWTEFVYNVLFLSLMPRGFFSGISSYPPSTKNQHRE